MPEALSTYLDSLIAGEYEKAYARTGLGALSKTSGSAATLSLEHFSAFNRADPLKSYAIRKVTKLDRRSINSVTEAGTPYFVVDLTLQQRSGGLETTISVEGDVVGVVEVDPVPVRVRVPAGELLVDGVAVPDRAAGERTLLLMNGAHSIEAGAGAVRFDTSPLEILDGPAVIEEGVLVLGSSRLE